MNPLLKFVTITTVFVILSSLSAPLRLEAATLGKHIKQTAHQTTSPLLALRFTLPPLPDRGAPGNRGEGASRGDCDPASQPLTALVPSYEQPATMSEEDATALTQVWGLTSAEHPSLWFYVPYDSTTIREIEFVLQTEQNQTLYRLPVSVPATAGIVQVQLPTTEPPLMPDQQYHWFFKVRVACGSSQIATLDYVEGWIKRVALEAGLRDRLARLSPQQRATLYAEHGLWHDALTTLGELRRTNPTDAAIARDWTALLQAIELENLANQPFSE